MLKLIIADDEHWVCQLIENLLPWNDLGIEIAGMAYNGLEAFDLISRISPDIVITDIKMPGLDGLELIQKCKGIDENISFILVSGHRDFEYAQNAIKHGADDYLLKPVTREDITHVIEKIIGKKRELLRTKAESLKIQDELNRNRAVLRKQLADNLLADECRGIARGGLTPEEINSRYAVNFGGGSYLVFILKLDYVRYHLANQKFISHMIGKVEPILEKNLLPLCRDLVFAPTRSAVYGFLNLKGEEHSFKQNLTVLFDEILGVIKEYHDYPVTLAVGCTVKNLNDLSLSFDKARDVLKCRIADKPNRILYSEKIGIYKQTARFLRLSDVERRVQDGVEQLNRTILEKNLAEIFDGLFDSQGGINPFTLYDTGEKILQSFVFVLEKIGIESQVSGDMKREVEGQLDFCITPSQYISRLIGLMVEQLRGIEETRRQTEYKPIRQAKDYIEQNYMSPISLEDLAEKVGLNPAYLSVLFKKETGSNYKDYLVQYRMKIAQTLLKDTNDTIAQIAHKTGYRDARHFSKTFDRVIGIKPNAYRKIYG